MIKAQTTADLIARYPLLDEEDISNVNNKISKAFGASFKGYRQYLIDRHVPRSGAPLLFE